MLIFLVFQIPSDFLKCALKIQALHFLSKKKDDLNRFENSEEQASLKIIVISGTANDRFERSCVFEV